MGSLAAKEAKGETYLVNDTGYAVSWSRAVSPGYKCAMPRQEDEFIQPTWFRYPMSPKRLAPAERVVSDGSHGFRVLVYHELLSSPMYAVAYFTDSLS